MPLALLPARLDDPIVVALTTASIVEGGSRYDGDPKSLCFELELPSD